ncbi:MAG: radical SAM protein [Candidatus Peribacteraceae bacterium]
MKIIPDIPKVFEGKFPVGFINDVADWGFSRQDLELNKGKLLTMDIDFTSGDQCSLNCRHCYSRDGSIDKRGGVPLSFEEILGVVEQGKKLGLKSVKLLGRGEHTEHPRLLEFLELMNGLGIVPLMFTKGYVIGDDALAVKYHGHRGIKSAEDLVARFAALNVRILLGFRSFDTEVEDKGVGNIQGYSIKRNKALELLVKHGYNRYNPTHVGLMAIPVTRELLSDIFEIYTWGKERNMYVCVTPSMVSGRGRKKTDNIPSSDELIDLYSRIYRWNISRGIQTLKQLKEEGVSAYAGSRPCQQIGCGVYVTLFGDAYRCPGDDSADTRYGNVRQDSLKDIWENSSNIKMAGQFNCHCPPKDGKTIPENFYEEVLKRVEEELS